METIPIRHINTATIEGALSESFSIRNIEGILADADMKQELHRHDFYYLLVLKNATGNHNIDFTAYQICDHSVFFMRPGQVHDLLLKAGSTGWLMHFREGFNFPKDKGAHQHLRKASSRNYYELDLDSFQRLQQIVNSIEQEYRGKKDHYENVIWSNMGILFIELIRQHSDALLSQSSLYTQEKLEKFLELLEVDVPAHKQVAHYSQMLNLTPYQLNSIVKATLGKTCSEVINQYVILEAKRCLLATSNQVNQIAYRLGYGDVSYFIRFFKKSTGYSPEAFRNALVKIADREL